MEITNLLKFINNAKSLYALDFATCYNSLSDFNYFLREDEQLVSTVNFDVFFLINHLSGSYTIIDGLNRFLCVSLVLHAICECYKKTSDKNEKAINTIRAKYLVSYGKTKLRLNEPEQSVYSKLIMGERLSGKEKNSPIFKLMHLFWEQIRENKMQAANIMHWLEKINVIIAETDKKNVRELYYSLNKNKRDLDQLLLIKDFLNTFKIADEWERLKKVFSQEYDIKLFLQDFFVNKFDIKYYNEKMYYENFMNYFTTMSVYTNPKELMKKIITSATLYRKILNVDLPSDNLNKALIQIKLHKGEDTFAYILNVYEDFNESNLTEGTFLEILQTIDEHLKNRTKYNNNNVSFNELIQYLNALISCK